MYLCKLKTNYTMYKDLATFVKERRRAAGLTQEEFALRAGVALTVVRKIEQGKENVSLAKVNEVLMMFGCKTVAIPIKDIL